MRDSEFPSRGRVLFTATLVRGHIAKFHIPYLKWFKERGWETWVAAKNDYPDGKCEIPYCDRFVDIDFARSPFSGKTAVAYRQLRELFERERFDLVHTHTPVGGVLTRLAARDARRAGTKVVYTAHGFHFYDGAPVANWLLWYPVEKFMSRFTDAIVTINREDYERAQGFARCRVEYVPGVGIDLSRFCTPFDREVKRAELGLVADDFAVLSIGDLNENKNHGVLIRALALLPDTFKLIVAGSGPMLDALVNEASALGIGSRLSLIGFRGDIPELLRACDFYCMPSLREGLPVSLMEAAATGTLCLTSKARGCSDVLGDLSNYCMVESGEPKDWANALQRLANSDCRDDLSMRLEARAKEFSIEVIRDRYITLYTRILGAAS